MYNLSKSEAVTVIKRLKNNQFPWDVAQLSLRFSHWELGPYATSELPSIYLDAQEACQKSIRSNCLAISKPGRKDICYVSQYLLLCHPWPAPFSSQQPHLRGFKGNCKAHKSWQPKNVPGIGLLVGLVQWAIYIELSQETNICIMAIIASCIMLTKLSQ